LARTSKCKKDKIKNAFPFSITAKNAFNVLEFDLLVERPFVVKIRHGGIEFETEAETLWRKGIDC
jgi:hypothetical protein